jgi:cystathionine beta-lyase
VITFCKKNIPEISIIQPEATYLLWLDCRKISSSASDLQQLFVNELKLGLNNGNEFGSVGEGFMRMNVACPRKTLETAMERFCKLKNKI